MAKDKEDIVQLLTSETGLSGRFQRAELAQAFI